MSEGQNTLRTDPLTQSVASCVVQNLTVLYCAVGQVGCLIYRHERDDNRLNLKKY